MNWIAACMLSTVSVQSIYTTRFPGMGRKNTGAEHGVPRDDWKYDEEWEKEEEENESRKPPPPEKQCVNCLHWVPREAPSCSWCGKGFPEGGRGRD